MSSQGKRLSPHLTISPNIYKTQPQTFTHLRYRMACNLWLHILIPFEWNKLSSTWNHATASSSQDTYGQMQLKTTAVQKHRFTWFHRENTTHIVDQECQVMLLVPRICSRGGEGSFSFPMGWTRIDMPLPDQKGEKSSYIWLSAWPLQISLGIHLLVISDS